MRRVRTLGTLLLILALATATGCWNRRELNDLAIVTALGVDKAERGFHVSVQVVDPSEVAARSSGGSFSPVTTYDATGDTMAEAIRRMTTVTPRKLYFAHLRLFVIGEALAREGMGNSLDLLSRDQEGRTDFYIVVAKGHKAFDVLRILTPMERIPASKMHSSLQVSERAWAPTVSVQLDDLITEVVAKGIQPALTGITIKGDPNFGRELQNLRTPDTPTRLQYQGIAVFRSDKLIGWLNESESKGFSDITNRLNSTMVEIQCPEGGKLAVEVIRSKSKMEGSVKNGKPEVVVTMRSEANVADVECHMHITGRNSLEEIEKRAEETMRLNAEQAVAKAKKLGTDVFGFGEEIHRSSPKYWSRVQNEWDQIFKELTVSFQVDMKIRRIGTVGESFLDEMKE
jgi:spore germination protein KC